MGRYANTGVFNVLYPTRRKIQKIMQQIILREGLIDTEALYDSIRINAKIPALGELEIQILAMYYFGFLNNGTVNMLPFDLCAKLTRELDSQGITGEIYSQYTEWMTQRYPILEVARILGDKRSIIYTFEPIGGNFSAPLSFRGQL
jgi:hypothetical protein